MPLVFAAITPHPPFLIPHIGKEKLNLLTQTVLAMEKLEQELYVTKPQLIIILSPHEALFEHAFTVNAHTQFKTNFEEFGDVTTSMNFKGSPEFAANISHKAKKDHLDVQLVSTERINHGASIPLFYLTAHLPNVKILPIGFSHHDPTKHIAFGELLKEVIMEGDRRVAVIASGDLAHCHGPQSPYKEDQVAASFDATLIELLETRNTVGITQIDKGLVQNAHECAYRSLLILLGVLKNVNYSFKHYSYEHPFGVGYLVGNFVI